MRRVVRRVAPLAVAAAALASSSVLGPGRRRPGRRCARARRPAGAAGRPRHGRQLEPAVAGGWRAGGQAVADVDGDSSVVCVGRTYVPAVCADNSSSARLDVPAGARIVAARLYVDTTLVVVGAADPGPSRRPGRGLRLRRADERRRQRRPQARRGVGAAGPGATPLRQAVWDVTDYVQRGGTGAYTVADIVFERAGALLPYASWAIVAAYELDPAADVGGHAARAAGPLRAAQRLVVRRVRRTRRGPRPRSPSAGSRSPSASPSSPRRSTSSPTPSTGAPTTCCSPASRWATT